MFLIWQVCCIQHIQVLVCFQKATVYWTSPRNCLRYQMILRELLTASAANVSWHSALGPSPVRTCKPAQSCGVQERPGDSWCARLATSPGLMAPAVATAGYATGVLAVIGTPPLNQW